MDKLSDYIIRPARRTYNPEKDLGPSLFTIDHKYIGSRIDFELKNRRKKTIKCSLFHHNLKYGEKHPLIIYCHGNSGNRTYSYEIVYKMLKANISVLTFDFAGCGLSEGKYVFLGYFEQYDIDDIIEYSLENFMFIDPTRIGVWGRSMGAVSALMHASRNSSLSLIILDSPFKDLSVLLKEYINKFKIISSLFGKYIYNKLKKKVLKKAAFDIEDLKPIEAIKNCYVPAFFFTTNKDKVVPGHHAKELHSVYPGEKEYLETKGNHNSRRQPEVYEAMLNFIEKIFARKNEELNKNISSEETTEIQELSEEKKNINKNEVKSPKLEVVEEINKPKMEKQFLSKKQDDSPQQNKSRGNMPNVPDLSDGLILVQNDQAEDMDMLPTDLCGADLLTSKNSSILQTDDDLTRTIE